MTGSSKPTKRKDGGAPRRRSERALARLWSLRGWLVALALILVAGLLLVSGPQAPQGPGTAGTPRETAARPAEPPAVAPSLPPAERAATRPSTASGALSVLNPPAPPAITEPVPLPASEPLAENVAPPTTAPPTVAPPAVEAPPPAWRRYAVAVDAPAGAPRIAVVIDDLGLGRARTLRSLALPAPMTLAFLSYAEDLEMWRDAARDAGHEVMLHLPMQPHGDHHDAGPQALEADLPEAELRRRLAWALDRLDGIVGINNHMGSRFTEDAAGMALVMAELKARGLLFLDSRTSPDSVAEREAARAEVPAASRDVFLDHERDPAFVAGQLAELENIAREHGAAIAIGHPHAVTLEALEAWLPGLAARGIALVPVSDIIGRRHDLAGRVEPAG